MNKKATKVVLVVEDDVELCNMMTKAIAKHGFGVVGVNNIRDASFRLKNQTYSCILIDMKLGEESGQDLIELIRTRKDYLNIDTPIMVISGYLDKDLLVDIRSKIQGALVKPFETRSMLETLDKLCK